MKKSLLGMGLLVVGGFLLFAGCVESPVRSSSRRRHRRSKLKSSWRRLGRAIYGYRATGRGRGAGFGSVAVGRFRRIRAQCGYAATGSIADTVTSGLADTGGKLERRCDVLCTVRRVAKMPGMPRDSKKFKNKACIAAEFS